ncbi:MAG: type II toxin-antitoxin system VapC family toxin [Gemmataceae bacterium]
MKLLLDTHAFLWYITNDTKLPLPFASAIRNPSNEVFVSAASIWEAVIKHHLGKLPLPQPPAEYLPRQRIVHGLLPLAVDEGAMPFLAKLPPLHRDPFDRILVAQAQQHGMTLASIDPLVLAYPVPFLPRV